LEKQYSTLPIMIYKTIQPRTKILPSILYLSANLMELYFVATTTASPTTSWTTYPTSSWYYKCKRICVLVGVTYRVNTHGVYLKIIV